MYLIIDELVTTLDQEINITKGSEVKYIRPYIYKHGSPSGSIKMSIRDDSGELDSVTLTIAEIDANLSTPGTYYHGFVRFTFDNVVKLPVGTYTIRMEGTDGYTFVNSSTAHIAWVQEFENRTNTLSESSSLLFDNPHSVQLWSYKWANVL